MLTPVFGAFAVLNTALPYIASNLMASYYKPTTQQYQLIKSFSLLLLGMFLSSLATLNFSLAFLVGLLASPLTFMEPWPSNIAMRGISWVVTVLVSPPVILCLGAVYSGLGVGYVLKEAAFGWDVFGMYTAVVIWCVWWPAWLVGSTLVLSVPVREKIKTA